MTLTLGDRGEVRTEEGTVQSYRAWAPEGPSDTAVLVLTAAGAGAVAPLVAAMGTREVWVFALEVEDQPPQPRDLDALVRHLDWRHGIPAENLVVLASGTQAAVAAAYARDYAPVLRALSLVAPTAPAPLARDLRMPVQILVVEADEVLAPTPLRTFFEELGVRPKSFCTVEAAEGGPLAGAHPGAVLEELRRFLGEVERPLALRPRVPTRAAEDEVEGRRSPGGENDEAPLAAALDEAIRELLSSGRAVRLMGLGEAAEHAARAALSRHQDDDVSPTPRLGEGRPNLVVALDLDLVLPTDAGAVTALRSLREHMAEGAYLIYSRRPHRQLSDSRNQAELDQLVGAAGFEKLRTRLGARGGHSVSTAMRPEVGFFVEDLELAESA